MEILKSPEGISTEINMEAGVECHIHGRQDPDTPFIVPDTARQFDTGIFMPNTTPSIAKVPPAVEYQQYIASCVPQGVDFKPYVTLYLTEETTPEDIDAAYESGIVIAVKYYPPHGSTNAGAGVRDFYRVRHVLDRMQRHKMHFCVHGETIVHDGKIVDMFDREKYFIPTFAQLIKDHPELPISLEHVSTKVGIEFIRDEAPEHVVATVTPQHILENWTTGLFTKPDEVRTPALRPTGWCLPILKREEDRQAVLQFAVGNDKALLGTDHAPHPEGKKININGCSAGCATGYAALELYAQAFESVDGLESLEDFASLRARKFYGLPKSSRRVRLIRQTWEVPARQYYGAGQFILLFRGGEDLIWKQAA